MKQAKLGIAPIAWWNDDLESLSLDVGLEECMGEAAEAGFSGMETGQRFPMNMGELGPILERFDLCVCGGWYSGFLLDGDIEAEKERIAEQLAFFKEANAPCIVYGEIARAIQGERGTPLARKPVLEKAEMAAYGRRISDFADWCAGEGMPLAYHPHMGAAVETEGEIDFFMGHSSVPLLLDTGHIAFSGGDVLRVINKHHARVAHVHVKDMRAPVEERLAREKESFIDAVVKGVFTVPGDGSLDFEAYARALFDAGYEGWFVVEAEQDPVANPPLQMARKGYAELTRIMAAVGYEVSR